MDRAHILRRETDVRKKPPKQCLLRQFTEVAKLAVAKFPPSIQTTATTEDTCVSQRLGEASLEAKCISASADSGCLSNTMEADS
eukprot:3444318-Amphidinium_carterae.1